MRKDTAPLRLRLAAGAAFAALAFAQGAWALPSPIGSVVNAGGGQPVITSNGDDLVTIDLNAQRTIIDWSNFDLFDHETARFAFDQRNWVVLNRVTAQAINIDGMVQAIHAANANVTGPVGGNVWFYSPQGVAFGATARVDVGGLLATSAAANQTAFLNTGNLNIPFAGSGSGGPVTIAGGAQFTGVGHLAFVAPRVTSGAGATINAGDLGTAAYGGVDSYEIQFIPIGNNDLAFFTFLVPSAAAGTAQAEALNLAGQTTGANVYLIAMSRATLTSQLINAPGLLVGQSSQNNYGQVTISTGRNIVLGQVGANVDSQQVAGVTTGSVRIGEINAGGNVNVYLAGTGSVGNLTATRIRAGQGLLIGAHDISIPGGTSSGDRGILARSTFVDTAGTVNLGPMTSNLDINIQRGNAQTGRTTGDHTLTLASATVGRDFFVFNGAEVNIGAITAGNQSQVFGSRNVTIGPLTTNGYTRVSSSQLITLTTVTGRDLDLRSAGGVNATSLVGTNTVSLGTGGDANVGSITGPSLVLDANTARLGTVTIANDIRLRVDNLDLSGALSAANLTLEDKSGDIVLGGADGLALSQAEFDRIRVTGVMNVYAGFTAGTVNVATPVFGTLEVRDLTIDPARIPRLALFANQNEAVRITGVLKASASGGELQIGTSEADSPWAPGQIVITGAIGAAKGDPLAGFTDIEAFDSVELHATNDILIGSERFVELVSDTPAAEIDIGRGLPVGVTAEGDEIGRLFVVAGNLALTADGRIVQQNTGSPGLEGGLYLTGAGVEPMDPILIVGGAQVADLFGAFDSGDGVLAIGAAGAFSNRIARPEGDTTTGRIRINGCLLGLGCALSTPASQFRVQQFRPAAPRAAVDPPVLTPPPPVDDDERQAEAVITGTGNEEIWRRDPR